MNTTVTSSNETVPFAPTIKYVYADIAVTCATLCWMACIGFLMAQFYIPMIVFGILSTACVGWFMVEAAQSLESLRIRRISVVHVSEPNAQKTVTV